MARAAEMEAEERAVVKAVAREEARVVVEREVARVEVD